MPEVDAVLLVGSCARRTDANDLDICALVSDEGAKERVEQRWAEFASERLEFRELASLGPFVEADLDTIDGNFAPRPRGWTTGPDHFEAELGNYLAHSVLLWERDDRLRGLRARWLPYYDDELRMARLSEARMYCTNDLEDVPLMIQRDEPFHAFHRLYLAFQQFLQCIHELELDQIDANANELARLLEEWCAP